MGTIAAAESAATDRQTDRDRHSSILHTPRHSAAAPTHSAAHSSSNRTETVHQHTTSRLATHISFASAQKTAHTHTTLYSAADQPKNVAQQAESTHKEGNKEGKGGEEEGEKKTRINKETKNNMGVRGERR